MPQEDSVFSSDHSDESTPQPLINRYTMTPVATAVIAALAPGNPALAQDEEQDSGGIEEIIVTATKRSIALQDVPQSIQAFSQESIEKMVMKSMEDYTRMSPSTTLVASQPGKNVLSMRGISTATSEWRTESRVAVYLDEQPITSISNQPDVRMVDIERVEILPGPQGTLLGSSSMSGAMRIITNKPDFDGVSGQVQGMVSTTDGGDGSYDLNGAINLPAIEEKLAFRVVGYAAQDGGYVDNVLSPTLSGEWPATAGSMVRLQHIGQVDGESCQDRLQPGRHLDARRPVSLVGWRVPSGLPAPPRHICPACTAGMTSYVA